MSVFDIENAEKIRAQMIYDYASMARARRYIFGFTESGSVFMCFTTTAVLPLVVELDKSSDGSYSLRYRQTREKIRILREHGATRFLCTAEQFERKQAQMQASGKRYNAGDVFECLVTEWDGQQWEKDHTPFCDGADVIIDGIEYEVKYHKGTFTTLKTLQNLKRRG